MAEHMRTSLVTDALAMAARDVTVRPGETSINADRGRQYTSAHFAVFSDRLGIRRPPGPTGTCSDNVWAGTVNSTHQSRTGKPNHISHP